MVEKRHAKRWQLFYYLRVFDKSTDELLGHVVDITTEGMLVISEKAIPKGVVYQLRMELPTSSGENADLALRAQSRWSTCDAKNHFFDTGFTLVGPSAETVEAIRRIIEELQLSGPADVTDEEPQPVRAGVG